MEEKEYIFEGKKISASIFYPTSKKVNYPSILFIHGWTSEKIRSYQYATSLSKLGYICFLFDMRGHGKSEGDRMMLTNKDFFHDVLTAYDELSKIDNVDTNHISAIGSSFGGYLVALLTSKRKLSNIVLRAAADYPNELFEKPKFINSGKDPKIAAWREEEKSPEKTAALSALHNFTGNVLILESEFDEQIPRQTTQNYIHAVKDKHKLTHIILRGATHSIKEGKFRDEVEKVLVDWFQTKV